MSTIHNQHQSTVRDDPDARKSFTWRRMRPWQIWTLAIVAIVFVVIGWLYHS